MMDFQSKVARWMRKAFSPAVINSPVERNRRFLEEALELVQANGMTQSEAADVVFYAYSRDQGDINQEVGGVMVTLAALCNERAVGMQHCAWAEMARIDTPETIAKIRVKQQAKAMIGMGLAPGDVRTIDDELKEVDNG